MFYKIVFKTDIKFTSELFNDSRIDRNMLAAFIILYGEQILQVEQMELGMFNVRFENGTERIINNSHDESQNEFWFFFGSDPDEMAQQIGDLIDAYIEQQGR